VRVTLGLRVQSEWEQIELTWDGLSEKMETAFEDLSHVLDLLRRLEGFKIPGYEGLIQDGVALSRQLDTLHKQMDSVLAHPQANDIVWLQSRAKTDEILLCCVPLRVERLVEQQLLWPKEAAIFTSATMRTNGEFTFIKERLGAADAEELALGSPFDYESQVLLYLPTDVPEPGQPYHQRTVNQSLAELVSATEGRTLVLFTSYSQLRSVHSAISRPLAKQGITVYAQGMGASRNQLLENFRTTPKSILLGTRSFWEGIDVPGEALSCVVMTKLPFAVPSDPVFAARSEELDDPFIQYAVPDAILRFRQGFGRLIRTKTDRGVVVVLDKRLQSKRYGELFVSSLPVCTTVRGPLAELPKKAALWLAGEMVITAKPASSMIEDGGGLEYVSFDDL
jgi:DNA polymerase-3 subunit epsilon/ATP-dependent DNA helicase DinG